MAEPDPVAERLQRTRWLFLRLVGVVYLIAFASLGVQVAGLIGPHGLMPAASYLEWARSIYGAGAYRLLPTLLWLGAGDTALRLITWGGAVIAMLIITGVATRPAHRLMPLVWLYRSTLS